MITPPADLPTTNVVHHAPEPVAAPSGNANHPDNADTIVSASELVRHFGHWQHRAAYAPVYIHHRGRARLVLTSVDMMEALSRPIEQRRADDLRGAADMVLDLTGDVIILVDDRMLISGISRPARLYFGTDARAGAPLETAIGGVAAHMLSDAVRRVLQSGLSETIDVASPYPGRRLAVTINPHGGGASLLARDIKLADDLLTERVRATAIAGAVMATDLAIVGDIDRYGYLSLSAAALALLTGRLTTVADAVQLLTLIDPRHGDGVRRALDTAFTMQQSAAIDAVLMPTNAPSRAVRIGFCPIVRGVTTSAVVVAIVAREPLKQA